MILIISDSEKKNLRWDDDRLQLLAAEEKVEADIALTEVDRNMLRNAPAKANEN